MEDQFFKKYCLDKRFVAGKNVRSSLTSCMSLKPSWRASVVGFFSLDPRMEAQQSFCSEKVLVERRYVHTDICSKKLLEK